MVIIDEAQLIPGKATFEELRLLTNFQLDDRNLLALVLIGQTELRERLNESPTGRFASGSGCSITWGRSMPGRPGSM